MVKLILPVEYSRLHPVFNVSLVMPYFTKDSILADSDRVVTNITDDQALSFLVNWISIESIIDHQVFKGTH